MERTTPLTELRGSPELLSRFADAIESSGIELVPADLLAELARASRVVGASPIAIDVLVDPTEPRVARERAFGLLATQLIGRSGRPASERGCARTSSPASQAQRPLAPTTTASRFASPASA